eukprot:Hpha_TRINITY_DN13901_c0_g1::TRINITY_DN13901_c0_g1_i1::g.35594::m.35594
MAAFLRLQQRAGESFIARLCDAANEAEKQREREERAALRIQSLRRMHATRRWYRLKLRATREGQRAWRGHAGRMRAARQQVEVALRDERMLFDHFACLVQKTFRGFYSRKWVADFYAQKRYLKQIEERNQRTREEGCAYEQTLLREREATTAARLEESFRAAASTQRHLCSTASQRGVLRPTDSTGAGSVRLRPELRGTFGDDAEEAVRRAAAPPRRKFKRDLPRGTKRAAATPSAMEA